MSVVLQFRFQLVLGFVLPDLPNRRRPCPRWRRSLPCYLLGGHLVAGVEVTGAFHPQNPPTENLPFLNLLLDSSFSLFLTYLSLKITLSKIVFTYLVFWWCFPSVFCSQLVVENFHAWKNKLIDYFLLFCLFTCFLAFPGADSYCTHLTFPFLLNYSSLRLLSFLFGCSCFLTVLP